MLPWLTTSTGVVCSAQPNTAKTHVTGKPPPSDARCSESRQGRQALASTQGT